MTGPTRREIERHLDALEEDTPRDGELSIVIQSTLIMTRERAEREGREILGTSEAAVEPGYVEVPAGTERFEI